MGYFRIFGCSFLLIVTFSVVLINDYLYSDRYGFLDIAITNILYPRNESLQIDVRHGNQHEQIMYVGIRTTVSFHDVKQSQDVVLSVKSSTTNVTYILSFTVNVLADTGVLNIPYDYITKPFNVLDMIVSWSYTTSY